MIFVRDRGRMCNNILQYGHVYAWAREHGRETMSMRFAYKYQYFRICHTRLHWFWVYALAKMLAGMHLLTVVSFNKDGENTQDKEDEMLHRRWVLVEGWYVRYYDLFLKYKDEIRGLFEFDTTIRKKIKNYLLETSEENHVKLGVHIRRGDYKTWNGGRYYFSDDTYIDYINTFISSHVGQTVDVYICGNDPRLDQCYYHQQVKGGKVRFPAGNPAEDLCLLSECDYMIGPPSTFTLVASMYRDVPLLWMHTIDAQEVNQPDAWGTFDRLFREIL